MAHSEGNNSAYHGTESVSGRPGACISGGKQQDEEKDEQTDRCVKLVLCGYNTFR